MKLPSLAIAIALSATALSGAAVAQTVSPDAEIVVSAKYQRDWDKGHKLEAEGLRDLERAQNDLIKYSADVVEAQNKRSSSASRGDNAEQKFRSLTAQTPVFTSGRDAERWAKKVETAAQDWAKYDNRRADGDGDFKKAVDRQEKAEEAVAKAEAHIAKGRQMKAEAERRSMLAVR